MNTSHLPASIPQCLSRRQFLERTGMGMGLLALATMIPESSSAQGGSAGGSRPHFPAKAKRVIHIFAEGGPSQVDTWDPKPELMRYDGRDIPGYRNPAFGSRYRFRKMGQSGTEVSEVFPTLGEFVDDMALIRSMITDIPVHEVAQRFMFTGSVQLPKPSLGSWVLYGLGLENQNIPGFISLGGSAEWRQASFLPGTTQGVNVSITQNQSPREILLNIHSQFTSLVHQRRQLDLARRLDTLEPDALQEEPQLDARIRSFRSGGLPGRYR